MEGLQAAARQQAKGGAGGGGARGAAGGGTGGSSSSSAAAAAGAMLPRAGSSRGSSEIQPHSVSDDSGAGPGGTYTREQVLELQRRVEQYKGAYEDSEHTHQLRDQSELALKEEVAKQQVWGGEGGVGEGGWGRRARGGAGREFYGIGVRRRGCTLRVMGMDADGAGPRPFHAGLPNCIPCFPLLCPSYLQALAQLSDADMVYLRGVLVSAFEAGTMPREGPMFQVGGSREALSSLQTAVPGEV